MIYLFFGMFVVGMGIAADRDAAEDFYERRGLAVSLAAIAMAVLAWPFVAGCMLVELVKGFADDD